MATGRVPTTANSPLTAKGDLFGYSTTQARVAVGSNGETLVADSSTSTGLRYTGNYAAGKNKIINGAFDNWQRGTSITLGSGALATYGADRFIFEAYGSSTAATVTRQTFTPGTAPVAGYEGQYFARLTNFATATAWQIRHRIENVQTFAGQTVTFSFWAKASTTIPVDQVQAIQNFGSGGSTAVTTALSGISLTTSWTRFTKTFTIPSISGKTIGTSSYLEFNFYQGSGATNSSTIDIWGWQAEEGSVATAFQTATGTLQGELAACQRYYFRANSTSGYKTLANGYAGSANVLDVGVVLPSQMRVIPTALDTSAMATFYYESATGGSTPTSITLSSRSTENLGQIGFNKTGSFTSGYAYSILSNNTAAFLGFSAEL
jgi:hypothetical protein